MGSQISQQLAVSGEQSRAASGQWSVVSGQTATRSSALITGHWPLVTGFTIIELLIVISVIAFLLGTGIGVYFAYVRTNAFRAETQAVASILQAARLNAIEQNSDSLVCVEPDHNRITQITRTTVGVFHFEDLNDNLTSGAFGHAALVASGTPALVPGKVGHALALDGQSSLKCKMLRGSQWVNIPTYDAREGIAIEAWIMPSAPAGTSAAQMTIVERQGWYGISLRYDPTAGRFSVSAGAVTILPDAPGYFQHSAMSAAIIRPNEWSHVSISYNAHAEFLSLRVNGLEAAIGYDSSMAGNTPDPAAETLIGAAADGTAAFMGRIDELIISAFASEPSHYVTAKLKLESQNLAPGNTIRFTPTGRLDPVHDPAPPKVILNNYQSGAIKDSATMTVGQIGTVDVTETHQ